MKRSNRPAVVHPIEWRSLVKQGKSAGIARAATIERDADGRVSFIASTATADRYGDTIDQTGWDTSAFEKNPVLLWAHSHQTPPVGKVGKLDKTGDLTAREIDFTTDEEHPFGAQVGRMVKGGFLNAVSVGFLPLEWEERYDEGGRFLGYHFKRMELLEISVVPVPANPQALLTGKGFAKSLAEWADEPDDSAPLARSLQAEVQGFMRAAEDLQTRADEEADAGAFAEMLKQLERIAVATEAQGEMLKQLLTKAAPAKSAEPEQAVDPVPVVPEAPVVEDDADTTPTVLALLGAHD